MMEWIRRLFNTPAPVPPSPEPEPERVHPLLEQEMRHYRTEQRRQEVAEERGEQAGDANIAPFPGNGNDSGGWAEPGA